MDNHHLQIGKLGEKIAFAYLTKSGYQVLQTNWRYKNHYEIDLVVISPDQSLVAVEVRSLQKTGKISPLDSIDQKKISQIRRAIEIYAELFKYDTKPIQVDVVSVVLDSHSIEHFESVDCMFDLT